MALRPARLYAQEVRILRRKARTVFVSIGIAVTLLVLWQPRLPGFYGELRNVDQPLNPTSSKSLNEAARNSTLGFEKILALSRGTVWRLHGLKAASQETGLAIEVFEQPQINDAAIQELESNGPFGAPKPNRGSAIAWLAHLEILKFVVQRGFSATLILEDDADWGVEIKDQMATLSNKVREFTNASSANADPYGDAWDVLWLGHCGEVWQRTRALPTLSWPDATVGRRADWRGGFETQWLMDLPEGHRSIFWSQSPLCTYAYAVSRQGAARVLEWATIGGEAGFDLKLQLGCFLKTLKCISVVDELFRHYRPPPELGRGSDIANINDPMQLISDGERLETVQGSTAVILHSARCKAMFGTTCLEL